MSRDYAKSPKPKHPHSIPGWVWMLGGLLIGLFVAFLVYLDKNSSTVQKSSFIDTVTRFFTDTRNETRTLSRPKQTQPSMPATSSKPRFDFYTILPELEVAIPEQELIKSNKEAKTSAPKQNIRYMLQAGSFRDHEQADRLKAKLALQGIEANIQTVTINDGDTWHRVRVGPLHDLNTLNLTRKRLQNNGIASIVVKEKG